MSLLQNSLFKRAVSGVILSLAMFGFVYYGGWAYALLMVVAGTRTVFEWGRMTVLFKYAYLWWWLGLLYVLVAFGSCYILRMEYHWLMTVAFFFMVAWSDIGAYFFGKTFGGPKLAGKISPNKTWSGYAGALIFPAVLAVVFLHNEASILSLLVFGAAIGVTGQSGDLIVSWLKRRAGVKDSGNLIPGHGGLMDRIDAMMLCAPVFLGFVMWIS